MPLRVEFTEDDLTAIDNRLRGIEKGVARTLIERPLKTSTQPWVERWTRTAPQPGSTGYTGPGKGRRRHGRGLASVLQSKVIAARDAWTLIAIIGADYSVAPHEHLVERGHDMVIGTQGHNLIRKETTKKRVAAKLSGRVPGGLYGQQAGKYTEAIRSHILLGEIGRALDKALKV